MRFWGKEDKPKRSLYRWNVLYRDAVKEGNVVVYLEKDTPCINISGDDHMLYSPVGKKECKATRRGVLAAKQSVVKKYRDYLKLQEFCVEHSKDADLMQCETCGKIEGE